jgi:hypothetical protein
MADTNCFDNTNPLYSNYFQFTVKRGTKKLELMTQRVNLPGLTVPDHPQGTIFGTTVPVPTLAANYEPLSIEFIVDENLENWKSIYSWIRNITNIKDANSDNAVYGQWHGSATLTIPNTNFRYGGCTSNVLSVSFVHIVPTKLSGLIFQSDTSDVNILKATCMFKYSYYELTPAGDSNLYGSPN